MGCVFFCPEPWPEDRGKYFTVGRFDDFELSSWPSHISGRNALSTVDRLKLRELKYKKSDVTIKVYFFSRLEKGEI